MDSGETACARSAARGRELIGGHGCRAYARVDVEPGEVARVVVDGAALGGPGYVDGPRELEREGVTIAERAVWPASGFGP